MFAVLRHYLITGTGLLFCTAWVQAQSFDQTVEAYGGAPAFDLILVQDCSVLDNTSDVALDQEYNARLCSAEAESALGEVVELLRSKGFNTVQVALSTAGAQIRPESRKTVADIHDVYTAPDLSDAAREAYIATLRRIARSIDVDAEAHELHAKELAALGLAENQVVILCFLHKWRRFAANMESSRARWIYRCYQYLHFLIRRWACAP